MRRARARRRLHDGRCDARQDGDRGRIAAKLTVKPRAAKLRKALKRGLVVKVAVPRSGKKVAAGRRSVAGGTATEKLQFNKKARKSLESAKRVKLAVKVKFSPPRARRRSVRLP